MSTTTHHYFQKTRRGKLLRVCRERYLGSSLGSVFRGGVCEAVSTLEILEDSLIIIPDTNVLLRQIDVLLLLPSVILCDTTLNETGKRDFAAKRRLRGVFQDENKCVIAFPNEHHVDTFVPKKLRESDNDYNDRLIRNVAAFFGERLPGKTVVFLSDDVASLKLMKAENVLPMRMHEFVERYKGQYSGMEDAVARVTEVRVEPGARELFEEHWAQVEMEKKLKAGKVFQGVLRTKHTRTLDELDEGSVLVAGLIPGKDEMTRVVVMGLVNINRALDGDRVAVEIIAKTTPEQVKLDKEDDDDDDREELPSVYQARVVGIIKKNWRACAGTLVDYDLGAKTTSASASTTIDKFDDQPLELDEEDPAQSTANSLEKIVMFIPMDGRMPRMIIRTRNMDRLQKERVVVQMDAWDRRSRFPVGHLVKSLGPIGEKDTETACTLFEWDIPTSEFSPAVMACLPVEGKDWKAPDVLPSYRTDLRHLEEVCSVDPPGCKDIDDALHARVSPNNPNRIEVGVHIADVSNFVLPGTPIDLEARNRGTSTYLVGKRLDMLPGLLTTDICSLVGNRDRFCFSVIWEMSPDGAEFFGEPKFMKSVIRSRGAHTYDEAQAFISDPNVNTLTAQSIRCLNVIAKTLKAKRIANGALTLASQEVKFELDEKTMDPTDVKLYEHKESHVMVEEFMLLANCAVAERIERAYPKRAVLRRHPKPSVEMLDQLVKSARAAGVNLDVTSSKALADSLDAAQKTDQPFFNQILRIVTTRAMQQAKYFCSGDFDLRSDFAHYGLAVPVYTHFTSPIRRYADLVVHRLLSSAAGLEPLYEGYEKKEDVRATTDNLNKRHRNAQKAGRASSSLNTVLLFRNKPAVETDAYISGISHTRVNVMIPEYGMEETLEGVDPETWILNEETFTLKHKSSAAQELKVFDRVRVFIYVQSVGADKRDELVVKLKMHGEGAVLTGVAGGAVDEGKKKRLVVESSSAAAAPPKKKKLESNLSTSSSKKAKF